MGKKNKDKKKGKGAEKTLVKTEKKLDNKLKKELKELGEESIEDVLAQIEKEEQKRLQVTEIQVPPPSRRINFSFVAHPLKDLLILYGGEYYNGQKTIVYNDLFFYNIQNNTWTLVKAPAGPPPRCGHQMVCTSSNKGQLWIFGGEYASPSEAQFYHYKDLWVFHLATKQWQKITAPDAPSARSGHRMVLVKKQIFIFGGYHDNLRNYKYFNDVYCFDLETYTWKKIEAVGTPPAPRSGCCMVALPDGKILIYGGYSKECIKKNVDKGKVHTDAFVLGLAKHEQNKYRWQQVKISGPSPSSRCSMPIISSINNQSAYTYGGVYDIEDDENICGNFYNDFNMIDLEKLIWRPITLNKKKQRISKAECQNSEMDEGEQSDEAMEVEEVEQIKTISDDGIFKVTIGPSTVAASTSTNTEEKVAVFQPSPRMNSGLAIIHGILYLYGGVFEDQEKEFTFNDLYSIDLKKMDEWKTIIKDDLSKIDWLGSDSESGEEDDDDEEESDESSGSEDE